MSSSSDLSSINVGTTTSTSTSDGNGSVDHDDTVRAFVFSADKPFTTKRKALADDPIELDRFLSNGSISHTGVSNRFCTVLQACSMNRRITSLKYLLTLWEA